MFNSFRIKLILVFIRISTAHQIESPKRAPSSFGDATTGGGQVLALLVQLALDPPQRALAATGSPLDLLQESLGLSQSSDGTRQGSISSGLGGGRSLARALSLLAGSSGLGSGLLSSLTGSSGLSGNLFGVLAGSSGLGSGLLGSLTGGSGSLGISLSSPAGGSGVPSSSLSSSAGNASSDDGALVPLGGGLGGDLGLLQGEGLSSEMLGQLVLGAVHGHGASGLGLGLQIGGLGVVRVLLLLHLGQGGVQSRLGSAELGLLGGQIRSSGLAGSLLGGSGSSRSVGSSLASFGGSLGLTSSGLTSLGSGFSGTGVTLLEGGLASVEFGLGGVDLLFVTLRGVHKVMPVDLVAGQQQVGDGHQLGLLLLVDGSNRAELGAHLTDGQGLVKHLQQAMGVQLIEGIAGLVLLQVDGVGLVHIGPELLGLSLVRVPEAVQEPHGLRLVRKLTDLVQLGSVCYVGCH